MKVTVQSKEERRREGGRDRERKRDRGSTSEGDQLSLCKLSHLLKKVLKIAFTPSVMLFNWLLHSFCSYIYILWGIRKLMGFFLYLFCFTLCVY